MLPNDDQDIKLLQEKQRLETILDGLQAGVIIIDAETRQIVDANRKAQEMFGATKEEMTKHVCHKYVCPTEMNGCQILDLGQTVDNSERVLINSKGEKIPILKTVNKIEINGVPHLIDSFVDLSEQKKIMNKMKDSEKKFRAVTDSARDAIIKMDHHGKVVIWNPAAEKMFGYSKEEMIGNNLHNILAPDRFMNAHRTAFSKFTKDGKGAAIGKIVELAGIHKDGHEIPVEMSLSSVQIDGEWHAIAIVRDITESKKANDAIRESEERFKNLSNLTFEGILIHNNGMAIDVNESFLRMFGYSREEIIGNNIIKLMIPEEYHEAIRDNIVRKCVKPYEIMARKKNGELIHIEIESKNIEKMSEKNRVTAIRDITERKKSEEAIRKSEEKYRLLSENSSDVIWTMDLEGKINYVSPSVEKLRGFTPEEVMKQSLDELVTPDSKKLFEIEVAKILQEVSSETEYENHRIVEIKQPCKEGSIVSTEVSASIIFNNDGEPIGIQGVSRDITQRKQMEAELRESEEKLSNIIENSPGMIMTTDSQGKANFISHQCQKILGYKSEEFIGIDMPEIIHPDDISKMQEIHASVMGGKLVENIEYRIKRGDNDNWDWISHTANPLMNNGKLESIQSNIINITKQKKAEEALKESEEKFRTMMNSSADAVFITDKMGNYIYVNRAATEMLGYTYEELTNMKITDVSRPEDAEIALGTFQSLLKNGQVFTELELVKKDGSIVPTDLNAVVMDNGNIYGSCRDITDRKKAELALNESEMKYRLLADNATDVIWTMDLETMKFTYYSSSVKQLRGYTPEEAMAIPMDKMMTPESYHKAINEWNNILNNEDISAMNLDKGIIFEAEEFCKNGSTVFVETKVKPIMDENGRPTSLIGATRDITERKMMEDALKKSQKQLSEAMDLAQIVNWEFDVASGTFTFDDRFYTFYGTTVEIEGGNQMPADVYAKKFVHPDEMAIVEDEVKKSIETSDPGYMSQVEHRIIRRDGEIRHIIVRVGIIKDEEGKTIKAHGANQDITERKKMEEDLKANLHDLERYKKATIDRELKMIELKEKIKKIRK